MNRTLAPVGERLNDLGTPSVEDRLNEVERALALAAFVSRALARADDLMLGIDIEAHAWEVVSSLTEAAYHDARAIRKGLPNDGMGFKAPDVDPLRD